MSGSPGSTGVWDLVEERAGAAGSGTDLWERLAELVDPTEFRPKLRDDIETKRFPAKLGNDFVMVANLRDLIHYRLPADDLELLRLMDGTRTVGEIVAERFQGSGSLDLSAAVELVRALYQGNFLETPYVDVDAMVGHAIAPVTERRRRARLFARTLTIEWHGANTVVRWLYDHGLRLMFRRSIAVLCVLFSAVGFGAFVALVRSGEFGLAGKSLALGFLVLMVLDYFMVFSHEIGHALVVIHNGRRIKSAGFQIYFGSPAFFVDSSDGMMMERGQQILESFAGPFAQLVLAGVSSLVALVFPEWALSEILYRFAVLNYLVVIMNLIPLLELDGYYILADVMEIPDLRERSLSFLRHDLVHKVRIWDHFSRRDVGFTLYAILGILFTIFSFYTAYFYWRTVFGDLVTRLWDGGPVTRVLLVVLAAFVAAPALRGLVNLVRSIGRRIHALWRRVKFRLESGWRVEAAELIDALPIFEDVPVDVLNELAGRVQLRTLGLGQPVFRQGDRATSFYVVRSGSVEVLDEDPETGNERQLRTMGRGESFGELGLVGNAPRAATVRALEESEVFEIDKGTFDRLLADMVQLPDFAPTLQSLTELRELPCFAHLSNAQIADLLDHGEWSTLTPGEVVIRQSEVGDAFYAISSGQVDVLRDGALVDTLGPRSYFGEVALLTDVPRTASVVARTPVRVFRLNRDGFEQLVSGVFREGGLVPNLPVSETLAH